MNTISIQDKKLVVNWWEETKFDHEINEVIDFGEVVVVLTMPKHGYAVINNIYGVKGGKIVWQVQDMVEYSANYAPFAPDPYTGIMVYDKDPSLVIATSGNGFRFLIDPTNGNIVGTESWVK